MSDRLEKVHHSIKGAWVNVYLMRWRSCSTRAICWHFSCRCWGLSWCLGASETWQRSSLRSCSAWFISSSTHRRFSWPASYTFPELNWKTCVHKHKLWSDLSMWWFMNSHCCISIAWDITSETRLKNQINKNLMCQQAQSNRSHVHPHLMWELLNSLQQTPGNFEDSISPVQDVLIYIPLQNTFHCMLPLFGTWQHSINGRPQRAHLRQTKYLCELLEK